ncbi:uncharacterized protein CLUP02_06034 [Colletotrichum lupini]|uniref:Uncharacterized protein n=1 Tax=Colletotrichum lupini TaxID=145971 RepID=A0A9Q8SND3_9PEZI|nr:uncharacterized protein CLUP02_06034 [Colletotrichum lupini]UQC80551.1 hypothetical protein CLUP02_06034 [Colletotrichum lupini]
MSLALAHTPLAACLRSARAFALTPCARNSLARSHLRLHPSPPLPSKSLPSFPILYTPPYSPHHSGVLRSHPHTLHNITVYTQWALVPYSVLHPGLVTQSHLSYPEPLPAVWTYLHVV